MSATRAQYYRVCKNSVLGNAAGLNCGDVLAVHEGGESHPMVPKKATPSARCWGSGHGSRQRVGSGHSSRRGGQRREQRSLPG